MFALIGGMVRLERHYAHEAEKRGIRLKIFATFEHQMTEESGIWTLL